MRHKKYKPGTCSHRIDAITNRNSVELSSRTVTTRFVLKMTKSLEDGQQRQGWSYPSGSLKFTFCPLSQSENKEPSLKSWNQYRSWFMVSKIIKYQMYHIGNRQNIGNIGNIVTDILGSISCLIPQNPNDICDMHRYMMVTADI